MQDFGFSDLRVVNEFAPPFEAAQLEARSAVGASHIMRDAKRFSQLPEAIADCTMVAGTTAIGERELSLPVLTLRDAAPRLLQGVLAHPDSNAPTSGGEQHPTKRVALLFGSEKTGLTNEHLSHCSLLLTIPLFAPAGRHLSMNLGQAVAVCLYELGRDGLEMARPLPLIPSSTPATSGDRERLTHLLLELMSASDYARRFPANARPEIVRQLAGSLGQSREQAATWMGFLKLVRRALGSVVDSDPGS